MTFCEGMRVRFDTCRSVGTITGRRDDGYWFVAWDDGDHGAFSEGAIVPAEEPPATRPVRTDWKVGWTVRMTDYALSSCPRLAARPTTATIAGVDVKGGVTVRFDDGGCEETFYNVTSRVHIAMCLDVVPPSLAVVAVPLGSHLADAALVALKAALDAETGRWRCPCCGGPTHGIQRTGRSPVYVCATLHCSPSSERYNVAYPVSWWGLKGETMPELAAEAGRRCMIHGSQVADSDEPSPSATAARYFYSGQARADAEARLAVARWPCPCCGDAPTPDFCGAPSHPCVLGRQHGPAATATCPACHSPTEARPDGPFCAKCGCLTRFLRPAVEHKHRWIVRGDRGRCAVGGCKAERDFSRASTGMGGPKVTCHYGCAVSLRGDGLATRHVERVDVAPPGRYVSAMLMPVNSELRHGATHYGCSACGAVYVKTAGDAP